MSRLRWLFFFQDIEFVQVLVLLYGIEMWIIVTVLILIILVVCHGAVILAVGGILVDIETLHPLMVEEGVVAGHLVELSMDLGLVLAHSEVKVWVEIIQMCAQEMEIGFAQILCKYLSCISCCNLLFFSFFPWSSVIHDYATVLPFTMSFAFVYCVLQVLGADFPFLWLFYS